MCPRRRKRSQWTTTTRAMMIHAEAPAVEAAVPAIRARMATTAEMRMRLIRTIHFPRMTAWTTGAVPPARLPCAAWFPPPPPMESSLPQANGRLPRRGKPAWYGAPASVPSAVWKACRTGCWRSWLITSLPGCGRPQPCNTCTPWPAVFCPLPVGSWGLTWHSRSGTEAPAPTITAMPARPVQAPSAARRKGRVPFPWRMPRQRGVPSRLPPARRK